MAVDLIYIIGTFLYTQSHNYTDLVHFVFGRVRLVGSRALVDFRRRTFVEFRQKPVRGRLQVSTRNSLQPTGYRRIVPVVGADVTVIVAACRARFIRVAQGSDRRRRGVRPEMRETGMADLVQQRIPFFFGRPVRRVSRDDRPVPDVVTIYVLTALGSFQRQRRGVWKNWEKRKIR